MALEEVLFQYGVAGAMLVYFIYDKIKSQAGLSKLIENNTIALTKVYEVLHGCKLKQKI